MARQSADDQPHQDKLVGRSDRRQRVQRNLELVQSVFGVELLDAARGIDLTLIQQETIDNLLEVFPAYRAEDARRNIVTRGIALNHLVGWRFRVGEVECIGQRLCEPCAHLDRVAVKGALRHLVHRGGLRADVVTSGSITVGDVVEPVSRSDEPVPRVDPATASG